jgi:hypothetical protein
MAMVAARPYFIVDSTMELMAFAYPVDTCLPAITARAFELDIVLSLFESISM